MRYHTVPRTDMNVSTVTLGTWVFGGDGWGGSSATDALAAVTAAVDRGVNLIDTAPVYGDGLAEELVGKALRGRRGNVLIATKCGLIRRGNRIAVDLSPESILREIDESLKRLGTDVIDIYQCHWPDPNTPVEATMKVLLKLKERRKIRQFGVSNFDAELLERIWPLNPPVTCQNQLSMLARTSLEDVLPLCREKGAGFLAYGPLAGGLLTGKYPAPRPFPKGDARSFFYRYYSGDAWKKAEALLDRLKIIARPLNQIAINWVRQQQGVTSVIVGCRNEQQVLQNTGAAEWELTIEQMEMITKFLEP